MPSRVIRGEINSSDSLSRVSIQADLTFRAILVACDDFGRMDARPAALKAALFPMRDEVSRDQVLAWVRELAAIEDAPLMIYEVNGREYLQLTKWEQHRANTKRANGSKLPSPPVDPQGIHGSPGSPKSPPSGSGSGSGYDGAPAAPWGFIERMLPLEANPPATDGEREAWLNAIGPELQAAAESAVPDGPDRKLNAEMKRIAFARWRVYRSGERAYAGSPTRAELVEMRAFESEVAREPPSPAVPFRLKQTVVGVR